MAGERLPPPPPPPVPATVDSPRKLPVKLSSRVSPFIQKLQRAPEGYGFEPRRPLEPIDPFAAPCGPYFFYGTLMDPELLSEILSLPKLPTLRSAKIIGYSLKLWGQYPALVDGKPDDAVEGMVYYVEATKHAERLVEYETKAYWPTSCQIHVTDGEHPREIGGTAFKYVGNPMDISEGNFDLDMWLRRMGRGTDDNADQHENSRVEEETVAEIETRPGWLTRSLFSSWYWLKTKMLGQYRARATR